MNSFLLWNWKRLTRKGGLYFFSSRSKKIPVDSASFQRYEFCRLTPTVNTYFKQRHGTVKSSVFFCMFYFSETVSPKKILTRKFPVYWNVFVVWIQLELTHRLSRVIFVFRSLVYLCISAHDPLLFIAFASFRTMHRFTIRSFVHFSEPGYREIFKPEKVMSTVRMSSDNVVRGKREYFSSGHSGFPALNINRSKLYWQKITCFGAIMFHSTLRKQIIHHFFSSRIQMINLFEFLLPKFFNLPEYIE